METYWGSGSITPHIFDLCTRLRWVVTITPRPLYPQGKIHWYLLVRRLGGRQSRSGRGEERNFHPMSGLEPLIIQLVAQWYITELSWETNRYLAGHKKFIFYGNWRFITGFTKAWHLSLSRVRWMQSTPSHPISLRSILILSYHLRLVLPSGLFPSGFPIKILYAFLILLSLEARICFWRLKLGSSNLTVWNCVWHTYPRSSSGATKCLKDSLNRSTVS
jgi:hypothetical protein